MQKYIGYRRFAVWEHNIAYNNYMATSRSYNVRVAIQCHTDVSLKTDLSQRNKTQIIWSNSGLLEVVVW